MRARAKIHRMRVQRRCRSVADKAHAEIYRLRRATLESYIEEMIALLDAIDGDPDLEDDEIEHINELEPADCHIAGSPA